MPGLQRGDVAPRRRRDRMSSDGTLATVVAASMLLLLGGLVAFFGYRMLWIILPIWGFFFGLAVGGQGVQAIFGDGFLSTAFSWIIAFCLGVLFAMLSYLFWFIAVALVGGYIGYAVVVGLFGVIGVDLGPLVWLVGVAVGIVTAILTLRFNLQKYAVIIGTSLLGAAAIVATIIELFNPLDPATFADHPVKVVFDQGIGWALMVVLIAAVAMAFQFASTRFYEVQRYNRWEEYTTSSGGTSTA
jgi:hypothetical protein